MARNTYVKTSAGWEQIATSVSAAAQGLAPIVPTSVAGTGVSFSNDGLVSFSASASVSLNGVFTSAYDQYLIMVDIGTVSGNTAVSFRLRSNGTDSSTSSYGMAMTGITTGGAAADITTTGTSATFAYLPTGYPLGSAQFTILDPARELTTSFLGTSSSTNSSYAAFAGRSGALFHNVATSYDGITVLAATNMTGTIRVYGYSSLAKPVNIPKPSPNYLINGGFDFWQRGTSFSVDGYCADRWYFDETGTCTVTQTSSALPAGFNYALEAAATTVSDSADIHQVLESSVVIPLRGQRVTFSCYLKMDANMIAQSGAFQLIADYSNSTDARVSQTTAIGTVTLTKSLYSGWARATYTFTVPTDAVGLKVGIEPPLTASPTTATYWVTGAMLELGSNATDFRRAGSTWTEEQAACWRYYQRHITILGRTDNTNVWKIIGNPIGEMLRATPTSVIVGTISTPGSGGNIGTNVTLTLSSRDMYYTSVGSSSNGAWLNFDDVKIECEL
jgi:hypothetical protein